MMNIVRRLMTKIRDNQKVLLGRWNINKNDKNLYLTNYYANIDHCGTCMYETKVVENSLKSIK